MIPWGLCVLDLVFFVTLLLFFFYIYIQVNNISEQRGTMAKNSNNKLPTERRDERHLARLGIVSIQTRVDLSDTRYTSEFMVENRQHRVMVVAPEGRPHGVDTDVILALQTLYVRQGCPTHGWIHTTAYELREMANLVQKGENYLRIKQSLRRLAMTSFWVSAGWQDRPARKGWDTELMRYIEGVRYREVEELDELPGLDEVSTLSIRLGEQLASSIRAGHTQVLDNNLLLQLEQPTARALCRLLEAHRLQADGSKAMQLTVQLEDWRQACGIVSDRPEIVRRVLLPAHEELVAVKYLREVVIEGRGKKQALTYHFQAADAADPSLMQMLIEVGFSTQAAEDITKVHGDRVEHAVRFALQRKEAGYKIKNMPGFVVDVLKQQEKYTPVAFELGALQAVQEQKRLRPSVEESERLAREAFERETSEVKGLSAVKQYEKAKAALRLILKKHLTADELKLLEEACLSGRIMAAELQEEVTLAAGRLTLGEYLQDLRAKLRE